MNSAAGDIDYPGVPEMFIDKGALVGKRRDDAYILAGMPLDILHDLLRLTGGGIFDGGIAVGDIDKQERLVTPAAAQDGKLPVIVLLVIEINDLFMTAVVISKQDLVADGIAGEVRLVYGVFNIVVFLRNAVLFPEDLVVRRVQEYHRVQLTGGRPPASGCRRGE